MGEWTETDQAYADFVSEVACEVSVSEDDAYALLGALEERGLFSISDAAQLMLSASAADASTKPADGAT